MNTLKFIELEEQSKTIDKKELIAGILISLLFFAGCGSVLWMLFPVEGNLFLLLAEGILLIAWMHFFFDRKQSLPGVAPVLVLAGILPIVTGALWRNGMAICFNGIVDVWKASYPKLMADFFVDDSKNAAVSLNLFLISVTALFAAFWTMVIRKRFVPATLGAGAVILILQLLLGKNLSGAASLLMPLFLLMMLAWCFLQKHAKEGGHSIGAVEVLAIGAVMAILIGAALLPVLSSENYEKPGILQNAQESIKELVSDLRYGGTKSRLPEGDFVGLASKEDSKSTMLTVTMSEPASLYLKGYTASVYTGTGFEEPEAQADHETSDLYYWLHQQSFSGLTQLSDAARVAGIEDMEELTVSVEVDAASRKYQYIPYELVMTENTLKKPGDRYLPSEGFFGEDSYTFTTNKALIPKYKEISAKIAEEELSKNAETIAYLQKEGYYNEQNYKDCLEVPEDLKSLFALIYEGEEIPEGNSHKDYNEAKQLITYYLNEEMTYSEVVGRYSGAEDFVYDFLFNEKEGYDIHFASAATLMFRYFGIPARYVEGYLIDKETAENAVADEPIYLSGESAHAWVEYYHDGLGWVPYEVTPAYLGTMEQAEDYQDISSLISQYQQEQNDTSGEEQQTEDIPEEEEQTDESDADAKQPIIWWKVLLGVFLGVLILLILAFLFYLLRERLLTAGFKQTFDDPDAELAIRNMFKYITALLTAYGVPKTVSPYMRERFLAKGISPECAAGYKEVVNIRQEAVYSNHPMTELQKRRVRRFLERLEKEVWENSTFAERFLYKFKYFL